MKMSVIYHSVTGNTRNMGEKIAEGMNAVAGVQARCFSIDDIDEDFVRASKCVVFGSPIYAAHISGQMLDFMLNRAGKLGLAGKLCGAYATAQYAHGGAELGIQEMLTYMMVQGGLVYSGGGSLGRPVIHLGPVGIDNTMEIGQFADYFVVYGNRMAGKAMELWKEE